MTRQLCSPHKPNYRNLKRNVHRGGGGNKTTERNNGGEIQASGFTAISVGRADPAGLAADAFARNGVRRDDFAMDPGLVDLGIAIAGSNQCQTDTTGTYAGINQPDPNTMFFIAGTFGGDVTREFDVPAGTHLLVPVLNNVVLQFSGKGPDPVTGGKGAANIATTDWQKSVTNLFLTIDEKAVGNLQSDLVRTDWFSPGAVQPNSLIESFGFSGELGPAKSDGFWAVIKGFAPGSTHTLDFGGSWNGGSVHIHDTIHAV